MCSSDLLWLSRAFGMSSGGEQWLSDEFRPVLAVIERVLASTPGYVTVEGHTDSLPIRTRSFSSNWALSSARAVSVAHGLFEGELLREDRFSVRGYADTRPRVANDTPANRAQNRRVEIVVEQGVDDEVAEQLDTLKTIDPGLYNEIRSEFETQFELRDDEIF